MANKKGKIEKKKKEEKDEKDEKEKKEEDSSDSDQEMEKKEKKEDKKDKKDEKDKTEEKRKNEKSEEIDKKDEKDKNENKNENKNKNKNDNDNDEDKKKKKEEKDEKEKKEENKKESKSDDKKKKENKIDVNDSDLKDPIVEGEKRDTITSGQLIDLLSKLNLDMIQHEIEDVEISAVDLDFFKRNDEIKLEIIEKAECIFDIWKDEPNNRFYFLNKLNLEGRSDHKFRTLDEFLLYLLNEFDRQFEKSCKIIREPKKTFVLSSSVFDPTILGFPLEEMMDPSCTDDNLRRMIVEFCRVPNNLGKTFNSYTMDELEVNECRTNILAYAQNQTVQNVQILEQINLVRLRSERSDIQRLPIIQSWEIRYPFLPCNGFQGVFDEMELASFLRSQYIAHVSSPAVIFKSADPGEMIKDSATSTTKTGFLSNLIATEYKPYMADEIAMFVLSLICPSDVLLEFDFSDVPNFSHEYVGFLSLIAKMFTMYDENGVYTNITRKSLLEIERNIAAWGQSRNVLQRIPNENNDFQLSNYQFSGRHNNNADIQVLQTLGVFNGISGINTRVQPNNFDELAVHFPQIMRRRNYAADEQDFEDFISRSTFDIWPIANAISSFLIRFRNNSWSNIFTSMQRNMLKWFVRLNEYLSVYWYNGFRMRARTAAGRIPANFESYSRNVKISGNTLAYMIRSFTFDIMKPNMDFNDILRFQSSFSRFLLLSKVKTDYVERLIGMMGLQRSFSKKSILELTMKQYPPIQNILVAGLTLNNQGAVYNMVMRYVDQEFEAILEPLVRINERVLTKRGIISNVIIHQLINRCTPEDIDAKLLAKNFLDNFGNARGTNPLNYLNIINLMNNRSLKATLYETVQIDKRILLQIFLPYIYNHEIDSLANQIPIKINDIDHSNNLRKRLEITAVPVTSIALDARNFIYRDNYVKVTTAPEACFIPNFYKNSLIIEIREAFRNPRDIIAPTPFIAKKKFRFVSSFEEK